MLKKTIVGLTILYVLVIFYLFKNNNVSLMWLIPGISLFLGLFIWGIFDMRLGFFLPVCTKSKTPENKYIALTFDDGPTEYTSQVLDLLKQYQAKATFFCIGKHIEQHPDIAQRILAEGHTIGNHSYSHPNNIGFLSSSKVIEQIQQCDKVIEQYLAIQTPFYRPPFGITNPHIAKAIQKTKHQVVGWNNRSLDTVIRSEEKIYNRIYKRITKKNMILLHDTSKKSVVVLEKLLKQLSQENYKMVNLEEFLKEEKQ